MVPHWIEEKDLVAVCRPIVKNKNKNKNHVYMYDLDLNMWGFLYKTKPWASYKVFQGIGDAFVDNTRHNGIVKE